MSAAGPELPPHLLAKRKRQQEEQEQETDAAAPGAKRQKSPAQEPARQIGPTLPPAPLAERPDGLPDGIQDSESSDEDDDFGPSLPGQVGSAEALHETPPRQAPIERDTGVTTENKATTGTKRDEWMTVPPKQDDLAARLDPTKPRARGFNTGKSARGPAAAGTDHDTWTETPEQKRKRLENQVMGVKPQAAAPTRPESGSSAKLNDGGREKAARIKENRGKSLYDMHQKRADKVEEDDPSKRAFEREKDIGGGAISGKQKRELLNKAAGFGSKFSSGSYL